MFIINWLIFLLSKLLYSIRGHDSHQIIRHHAFKDHPEPTIALEAPECGPSGSDLLPYHTCLDEEKVGKMPVLRWRPLSYLDVKQYVLVCEALDAPVPFTIVSHGLFFNIPPSTLQAYPDDVVQDKNYTGRLTLAGWGFVPNMLGSSYTGAAAPLGHGTHRYVFTIIALDEPLHFDRPDKVIKSQVKQALVGKILGWGQWTGHFERPWPR
ncbi:phosphatidylethanolamine-binding protein [Aspergillus unguis]